MKTFANALKRYPNISRLLLTVHVTNTTIKFSLIKRDGDYGLFVRGDYVEKHETTMTMEEFHRQSVEIRLRDPWKDEFLSAVEPHIKFPRDNRMMSFSPGTLY